MRNLSSGLSWILWGVLLFTGCKKAQTPAPAPQANQPIERVSVPASTTTPVYTLRVQWPVGRRFIYRMDFEQHSTNMTPGQSQGVREDVSMGLSYALSVLHELPEHRRELEFQFLTCEMEIKDAGELVVGFDSTAEATNSVTRAAAAAFARMTNSNVWLETDGSGKVAKVLGVDDWAKSVAGDKPGPIEQMLVQQFNDGFFQQTADFGRGLPDHAVHTGDSWSHHNEVPAGSLGRIAVNSSIRLVKWEEHGGPPLAVITAKGVLTGVPGPETKVFLASGAVNSSAWFDAQQGALVESVVEQVMQLTGPSVQATNAAATNATFKVDLGQKVTTKLVESTGGSATLISSDKTGSHPQ